MSEKAETKAGSGVRIWTGKLRMRLDRNKEGSEVEARIIVTGAAVVFEVHEEHVEHLGEQRWRTANADEIHAASWLRALGMTGAEVA